MLTSLSIKNYALIDTLLVDFNQGFTIITGETGAGKSILLGGLSLILGKRADLSSLKNTDKKCVIEAVFNIESYKLENLFKAKDLDFETQTIIRREILPSGKSRAFVNDTPVNLNTLQVLGNHLIDVHSQNQTMQLVDDDFQFQIIDALASNKANLQNYQTELQSFKKLQKELKELNAFQAEALKEQDYNTFLLKELNEANLVDGELESLEEEYETLNNIEEIQEKLTHSHQLLQDDDLGILNLLTQLKNTLQKLSTYSNTYQNLFTRVNSSLIELDDTFAEIETLQENLDADPKRLEVVNAKLQMLHNLMQKHVAENVSDLISIKEELSQKVSATENLEESINQKQKEIQIVSKKLDAISKTIHDKRHKTIPSLIKQLESILSDLGMPNAQFKIEVTLAKDYTYNGKDQLSFMFSANKGGQFNALKKAASGGELARIMLAIKSILSNYIQLPTIMFDEIDTGVSGEIANKMADIMQNMSKTMQVFAITHLPQIAAKGHTHFKVYKEDIEEVTTTNLVKLTHDKRVVEIAQMLGGLEVSASAMAHAKQLLN
ncbi:DNA repair protein RecN [Lacinutrix sp. C3R15]|uniref:DNA repair protein RecN n=1 Tax=Flavobacteriaceae TaxID=49546 RepID=UPI001C0A33D2|nr:MULTISPECIES: DNA repair protein RecN [Flavobacteriaceae]MBU2940619.1 DNA repair protein RecN [Lacinutrix sp. C3R15]MDO6623937.1 DNA repair protein RecN [Oceanihabitans sp. 1_MG-2023]